jgi:hypothetical protein
MKKQQTFVAEIIDGMSFEGESEEEHELVFLLVPSLSLIQAFQ